MPGRLVELILFGIAPLVLVGLALPGAAVAQDITISGEVSYRERIALPPDAVLTVRLTEMSLADMPGAIVAEETIEPAGQVPIEFELKLGSAVVRPNVGYALQARISAGDRLLFVNDERHAVDPAAPEPLRVVLKMVGQGSDADLPSLFDTIWLAEDIAGGGVIDNAQSTLVIASDGKVSGRGGCNGYFSEAEIDGNSITFGTVGSTFMACAPAVMDQEQKLFAALEKSATYRIDGDGKLFLVDAEGVDLARFAATAN